MSGGGGDGTDSHFFGIVHDGVDSKENLDAGALVTIAIIIPMILMGASDAGVIYARTRGTRLMPWRG